MIVKVLLFEDRGVYDSIHRAKELFQGHLAEQVAGDFGLQLTWFPAQPPGFAAGVFPLALRTTGPLGHHHGGL